MFMGIEIGMGRSLGMRMAMAMGMVMIIGVGMGICVGMVACVGMGIGISMVMIMGSGMGNAKSSCLSHRLASKKSLVMLPLRLANRKSWYLLWSKRQTSFEKPKSEKKDFYFVWSFSFFQN